MMSQSLGRRLEAVEDHIELLGLGGERRAADMSPAERRARLLELVSKELGLGHAMSEAEYEAWLVKTYPAASEPTLPDSRFQDPAELDAATRRELIEAYRAREAWKILQRRKVYNPKRANVVMNEEGA